MNDYAREYICMCMALGGVVGLLIYAGIQNVRDRKAAREAAKRDRLHQIAQMGFGTALLRGWIDEKGNPIERVGTRWEDLQ